MRLVWLGVTCNLWRAKLFSLIITVVSIQSAMSTHTITTRKATLEDTQEVQRIWAASFANDPHTLFKAHEKGIEPVQELPLDMIPSWIGIKLEDGVFLVGTDAAGSILGWASWWFYNLEGAKKEVSHHLVAQLTSGRFA